MENRKNNVNHIEEDNLVDLKIGKTGSGKTFLLKQTLVNFIIRNRYNGIPFNDLVNKLEKESCNLNNALLIDLKNNKDEYLKILEHFNINLKELK